MEFLSFVLVEACLPLEKKNSFTLYHNFSDINLSPLTYLDKDKIYLHKSQLSH